jgi:hypothetical protein
MVSDHQKDQLLAVVFHYMRPELRRRVMTECPLAYNAYVGREVVEVRRVDDGAKLDAEGRELCEGARVLGALAGGVTS